MAKRGRKPKPSSTNDNQPAASRIGRGAEARLEGFAEDLGRLIGTAQAKAESWLGQRNRIVENLTQLRDTANNLLTQLGHGIQARRGRRAGRSKSAETAAARAAAPRKRRTMSAKARKAISDAQKKRWAKLRAAKN